MTMTSPGSETKPAKTPSPRDARFSYGPTPKLCRRTPCMCANALRDDFIRNYDSDFYWDKVRKALYPGRAVNTSYVRKHIDADYDSLCAIAKRSPEEEKRLNLFRLLREKEAAAYKRWQRRLTAPCFNRPMSVAHATSPEDIAARERWREEKRRLREQNRERLAAVPPLEITVTVLGARREQQPVKKANKPRYETRPAPVDPSSSLARPVITADWRVQQRLQARLGRVASAAR